MINEYLRELRRNINGVNKFYKEVISFPSYSSSNSDSGLGGVVILLAAPVVYAVGFVEPLVETPVKGLLKLLK